MSDLGKLWYHCHIECATDGYWHILWPDNTAAYPQRFKTKGWATRTLNELRK